MSNEQKQDMSEQKMKIKLLVYAKFCLLQSEASISH